MSSRHHFLPSMRLLHSSFVCFLAVLSLSATVQAQKTTKPVLHGKHWVAITGKPLAATAGGMTFTRGGNAVDAACAMLAATSTMWDTLGWGGETQALIYNPHTGEVKGINALGVAPTGATAAFFRDQGMLYPPEYGPLAAVTPGTPGGLMVMLAEYGKLSLAEVLAPAMQMAEGYPIEQSQADNMERRKDVLAQWSYSKQVFLPHLKEDGSQERAAPYPGEIFSQPGLLATLQKLVETEAKALAGGKNRKEAIYAAYDRFYRGDIARELIRSSDEYGGLMTMEVAGSYRRVGNDGLQGHRGAQTHALGAGPRHVAGPEYSRGHRPEEHGLQQCALHPRLVPGHEPVIRGPGFLLWRPLYAPG